MKTPIRIYKLKRIVKDQSSLLITLGVFILLLFVVLIFYGRYNEQKKEVELMNGEVKMLKNRYETLKYNKSLTEDQIKEFNLLLASLVPETEDFFSIIYALDQISEVSGFQITDYTIDVGNASREILTLNIVGKGNPESFLSFLREYHFTGGRLITSNKIQYGGVNAGNTKVTLNFYSKQYTINESIQVPQLSKQEIDKLNALKAKIKFQFSSSGFQSVSTDYSIKTNPFVLESK